MSEAISTGLLGPGYWTYMAAAMAEHAHRISEAGRTFPAGLPQAAYASARRFFASALEQGEDIDPSAALASFKIAADTMLECVQPVPTAWEDISDRLARYAQFVQTLDSERDLTADDRSIARELERFFLQLVADGEEQDYVEAVRFDSTQEGRP